MIMQNRGTTKIEGIGIEILLEYQFLTRDLLKHFEKEDLEREFKLAQIPTDELLEERKKNLKEIVVRCGDMIQEILNNSGQS